MIAEYDNGAAPANPSREYVYAGGALLAKFDSSGTEYYQQDQSSVRMMTDSSGSVIGERGDFPFGEQWYSANTATKWAFTSYERDAESGNNYAIGREYVNRLGRFSALDAAAPSISDPQSMNRYSYVENDPINNSDPTGEWELNGMDMSDTALIINGPPLFGFGWSEFGLLELAVTPDGGQWEKTGPTIPGTDIRTAVWVPSYPNIGAVDVLGLTDWPVLLDRISGVITKILRQANDCSNFFNNSPVVQAFGMINEVSGNGPTDALGFFNSDTLKPSTTTLHGNPYPNDTGAETYEGTGANSEISINANPSGAFLGGFSASVGGVGGFPTGSLRAQVTMILHELAHTLAAVPGDSGSKTESEGNTDTVLAHCKKAIVAAVKSVWH